MVVAAITGTDRKVRQWCRGARDADSYPWCRL